MRGLDEGRATISNPEEASSQAVKVMISHMSVIEKFRGACDLHITDEMHYLSREPASVSLTDI